jgi:sigma-B regulation protein RsbU (phosphoserine phosphatase)
VGIQTFKSKILLLVLAVLLTAAVALVTLSKGEIERSLYRREQAASMSVLYLMLQAIESQYQDLIYHNRTVLEMRKDAMKDLTGVVISTIDASFERYRKGLLSEDDAKRQALEQVKKVRYRDDDYFFVFDTEFTAISHPDPLFMGKRLRDYRDAKGLLIVQELMKASLEPGGAFVFYWWKRLKDSLPLRKIGYAVFYPKWRWMVATGLYIDDLDADYQGKLNAIVAQLKSSFAKIKAEKGSSLFLFNGSKDWVIPPVDSDERPHLDDFVKISKRPNEPLRYLSQSRVGSSPTQVWKEAYVAYFEPLDWYVVATFDEADLKRPGETLIRKAAVFTFIALLVGLVLAYVISMKISRPLSELAGFAKDLATRDFSPEPYSAVEKLSSRGDEVGRLAAAFSFMQKRLKDYLHRLQETTAAKERIESELRIGREIQMGLLPRKLTQTSGLKNFAIHGFLEPAREVGGDFYDYFYIDDGHLCLVVGDVCGKGVPASLFMAVCKTLVRLTTTLIRALTAQGASPDEVLRKVNSELARENDQCMFVTIFLAHVELETGKVEYSNAGHNPPFLVSADRSLRPLDNLRALPAGVKTDVQYAKRFLRLLPGDMLFMYTDGITEAENSQGNLFSEDRLKECLTARCSESLEEYANRVLQKVANFRGSSPQGDDITLLVFKYLGTLRESPVSDRSMM